MTRLVQTLFWGCAALLLLHAELGVAEDLDLRVMIVKDAPRAVVGASAPAKVLNIHGKQIDTLPAKKPFIARGKKRLVHLHGQSSRVIWIDPGEKQFVYINRRWYRGKTLLIANKSRITAINYVDIERYLYSVVGGEMSPTWPVEALKAQAVAARTYALYKRRKAIRRKDSFDLGATARWQVYKGITHETPRTRRAVKETWGLALTYEGDFALTAYHSTSGGHTEHVKHIWGSKNHPYLKAVPDFDQASPVYQWRVAFPSGALKKVLSKQLKGIGTLKTIVPTEVTPQGHVKSLEVRGSRRTKVITGRTFKHMLKLKSTRFKIGVEPAKSKKKGAVVFVIHGKGFGHGLGLSQFGAKALAKKGYSFYQILMHYYRDTTIARVKIRAVDPD